MGRLRWTVRAAALAGACLAAGPAAAHEWYKNLRSPSGEMCCDVRDCSPVGLCVRPNRGEGLLVDGICHPIPWDKVLPVPSPDGDAHACWLRQSRARAAPPSFRCVILPGSASLPAPGRYSFTAPVRLLT